jgi:peptidoglycan/xylan/chitin deacetylase (PgdA/CDA1 family)
MKLQSKLGVVRPWLAAARREMLCSLKSRFVTLQRPGPFVSFAFDDFPRTAFTEGGTILKNAGMRGTYYVAMGLVNTSNHLGDQFRIEDLHAAAAEGHEIATHTFSHSSSRKVSLDDFRSDVRKGHGAICEVIGLTPTANFAYPFGEVTVAVKQAMGEEMRSCRGIYGGLNGPVVDLNLLRANPLYGGLGALPPAERLIQENQTRKSWLIFYTHDVRPNPSPYGCTPELLEAVVRLVKQAGATVLPVAEVLEGTVEEPASRHTEEAPGYGTDQGGSR